MKKFKILVLGLLIFTLAVPAVGLVAVPQVEAACSYQGYYNSQGKCDKSFKKTKNIERRLDQSSDQEDLLKEYIERLLALISLLQDQQDVDQNDDDSEIEITTRSAINVDEDSAKLRGEVDFNDSDMAEVWFEYGRSRSNLVEDTLKVDLEEDDEEEEFQRNITGLDDDTRYYFRAVGESEDGDRDWGSVLSFRTDKSINDDDDPEAITAAAQDIEENTAELNGSVDMNDFNNGRVFFVYGEDEGQVENIPDDHNRYAEINEDGDNLQKVLIDYDLDSSDDYRYDASNLDEDTKYYFSMCVEYEDVDDDDVIICGSVRDFTTDGAEDQEPTVETDSVQDIASTTAELNGSVDMNDFNNGRVFFVYGEDETRVSDVPDDYDSYGDIPSNDDELIKVSVDSDLDAMDSYAEEVDDLVENTNYFYSMCVEFEDEDSEDMLICGDIESFETVVTS